MLIEIIFKLIGGLGIFLLGMRHLSDGLQAIAGERLRTIIGGATGNRALAVLAGTLTTVIVQSSSITTVLVVGFVNSGFMTLVQAIGVVIGANIGTTITGWILVLKIGKYGLPILGVAALTHLFAKRDRLRYAALAIMGLGMIFFGLELMKNGMKPMSKMDEFQALFHSFQADSYFGVLKCALIGCLCTFVVQSSSATLAITIGMAATGLIDFRQAAALVLGENIGTTITAMLAAIGATTNAKRAAAAHVTFNLLGVAWATALFAFLIVAVRHLAGLFWGIDPGAPAVDGNYDHVLKGIALTHSTFNITNAVIFIVALPWLAKFVERVVPDKAHKEPRHLAILDPLLADTPAIAIVQSHDEVVRMGDSVKKMMGWLRETLASEKTDEERDNKIFRREDILDVEQKEITEFVGHLLTRSVPFDVMEQGRHQLRIADEFESISDYIVNVLKLHIRLRRQQLDLSPEARTEMLDLHDHVEAYMALIVDAVKTSNHDILTQAQTGGERITHLMKTYREAHLARIGTTGVDPMKSLIYTDMLNAYRRIKDHGLNIAEAEAGEK